MQESKSEWWRANTATRARPACSLHPFTSDRLTVEFDGLVFGIDAREFVFFLLVCKCLLHEQQFVLLVLLDDGVQILLLEQAREVSDLGLDGRGSSLLWCGGRRRRRGRSALEALLLLRARSTGLS